MCFRFLENVPRPQYKLHICALNNRTFMAFAPHHFYREDNAILDAPLYASDDYEQATPYALWCGFRPDNSSYVLCSSTQSNCLMRCNQYIICYLTWQPLADSVFYEVVVICHIDRAVDNMTSS